MKNVTVHLYQQTGLPPTDREIISSGIPLELCANIYDILLGAGNRPPTDQEIITAVFAQEASASVYAPFVKGTNEDEGKTTITPAPNLSASMYHAVRKEKIRRIIQIQIDDKNSEGFQDALMKVVKGNQGELEVTFYQGMAGDGYYVIFNRTNEQDFDIRPMLSAASSEWMDALGEAHCKKVLYPLACQVLGSTEVQDAIAEAYL